MNISRHISELLYEHDCVIIPGFGAFVCNYSPAYIDKEKNLFYPPFKKILFNCNLKNNDGLLANHIAMEEKISFHESNKIIHEFVSTLQEKLFKTNCCEIENIGRFFCGQENTIHFEQNKLVNYLPDSIGLSVFYSVPVKREPIERKFEKAFQNKVIAISEKRSTPVSRKVHKNRHILIATSILFVCLFVSVFLFTDLLKNVSSAGWAPFTNTAKPLYQPSEIILPEIKESKNNLLIPDNDTAHYLNIVIDENIPIVVQMKEETKRKDMLQTHSTKRFKIIGGAFAVPENAEKFKRKLRKMGYDAFIIERKLRLVSYGEYSTREEALHVLERIRTVQSDAWLMCN